MGSSEKNYGPDYDSIKNANEGFRRLTKAFGLLPCATVITSPSGIIEYANPVFLSTGGYTQEDIEPGKQLACFLDDDSSRRLAGEIIPLILSSKKWNGEMTLRKKDGSAYAADIFCSVIADDAGKPAHFLFNIYGNTERRKAEESLHERERFFVSTLNDLQTFVAVLKTDAEILFVNNTPLKLAGLRLEDVRSKKFYDLTLWAYSDETRETIKKDLEQCALGSSISREIQVQTLDGLIWIDFSIRPVYDKEGKVEYLVPEGREITKRKKAEDSLWESQTRYQAFVENTVLGISVVDTDYKILTTNTTFAGLFKKPACDFVGKYCFKEYEKRDAICPHCPGMRAMASGKTEEVETQGVRDDGTKFYVRNRAVPFFAPDGRVKGFIEMVEDIDERKKMEISLQESEEKYRQLVERANDGIIIIQDGIVKYANRCLMELWGGTMDTVVGHPFIDFIHPDERLQVMERYKQRMAGADVSQVYETAVVDHEGRKIPAELNAGLISYQGKPADLVYVRDITERKKAEESMGVELYKFKVLYELALNMQEKTLEENLPYITDKARELLNSDTAYIGLCSEDRREMYMHTLSGIKTEAFKSLRLPYGKGLGWLVMQTNKGYIVDDYYKDRKINHAVDRIIADEGLISGMAVPIHSVQGEIGVLYVYNRTKTHYTEDDLATLMILGNLAGIEISGKRGQQALQESRQHMADIINFLPDATLVIDKDGIVIAWNKAIEDLTGLKAESIIGKGDYEYGLPFYGKKRPIFIDLVGRSDDEIKALGYSFISKSKDTIFGETKAVLKGKETLLWLKASPIYDNTGQRIGAIESMRDITSRRAVEDALKDKNALLNSVINSAKDTLIFALDKDYRYVTYNENHRREMKNVYGADIDIGKSMLDYITAPEVRPLAKASYDRALSGESFTEIQKQPNQDTWYEFSWNPTLSADGKIIGINVFTRDISERRKADEAIREASQIINRSIVVAFLWKNEEGWPVEYVSENVINLTGYSATELTTGKIPFSSLIHKDDLKAVSEEVERFSEDKNISEFRQVYRIVCMGDEIKYIDDRTLIRRDKQGNITHYQGLIWDITEQKKAEEALIKSQNEISFKNTLLEGQSESSIDGILVVDHNGKTIQSNKRFAQMWNIPGEVMDARDDDAMIKSVLSQLKEPDKFVEKVIYLYSHKEEKSKDEVEFINAKTFERYSSPLTDPNGKNLGRIWYFHDISNRKIAEDALRESEGKLADIIDFLPDATFVIDNAGLVIAWNKAIEQMTGVKAENIIGKGNYEYSLCFHNERIPILIDLVLKPSFENEKKYSTLNLSNNTLIGEVYSPALKKDLWGVSVALYDAKGNITGAIESIKDVTEKKKIDNALKNSEVKFKTFFNNASDAVFIIDSEGRLLEANQVACDVLGYTKDEMKNFSLKDITGDGLDFFKEKLKSTLDSGSLMFEGMHKRKDNTFIPVEVNSRAIEYEGSKAVLSISRDITERKKYEEKLRMAYVDLNEELKRQEAISKISSVYLSLEEFEESTKKVLKIIGEVSGLSRICIFENDQEGKSSTNTFSWVGIDIIPIPDGQKIVSFDEMPSFSKLMHEKGVIMASDVTTLPEDLSKAIQTRGIKSIFILPLTVNNESYGYITFSETREQRDWDYSDIILLTTVSQIISEAFERKISDEQLKKRNEEVENSKKAIMNINEDLKTSLVEQKRLEKIKTEFLSVTSHELRTPITPMKAQLQMVLGQYFGTLTKEQKTSLEMVLRNATRLDHLICDILDISKLESGNMKFIVSPADLNELVRNSVETLKYNANEKNITLDMELGNIPPMSLDKDRITQVIMNLITNAVKFTDSSGCITVKTIADKDKATVEVSDNGIGMKDEDIKRLFTPFFQVDSSRSRNHEGTGLGLAICKGIVINHGGEINVRSTPGKGSTFSFTLPYNETINTKVVREVELFKLK